MTQTPICSVITPCYNAEDFIGRTIESVRRQTLPGWEYIIVDDGSHDGSAAAIEVYCRQDPRLRLIRQANAGVAVARNRGAAATTPGSKYLLFLDHDDCLTPEALERLVRYLEERAGVGMVYCAWSCIDADDRPLPFNPLYLPRWAPAWFGARTLPNDEPETPFATLLSCFNAFPSATLHRRSVFEQTPGFDSAYRYNSDKEIVLQMALRAPVHYFPTPLMLYRRHGTNMSSDPVMFAELRDLFQRWWHDERLTPRQRPMVRNAILFDRLLSVAREASAVLGHLKRGERRLGARRAQHAVRKAGRLALTAAAWLRARSGLDRFGPRVPA